MAELDAVKQARVVERVDALLTRASSAGERKFPRPEVRFDLRGRAAGQFRLRGREAVLRFNPAIFQRYFDDNLENTVAHEVAHYLVYRIHGWPRRKLKPHGVEWRQLMSVLGVVNPGVCHSYDLSDLAVRRERRFRYRCACRVHELTTRRHYRVLRGKAAYHCRRCGAILTQANDG